MIYTNPFSSLAETISPVAMQSFIIAMVILIGSGKGVVSVSKIYENKWKRKSLYYFKLISKIFNSEIKKCKKITIWEIQIILVYFVM